MADYLQFSELQTEVKNAIKAYNTSDAAKIALVKTVINQVYLNEIPFVDIFNPLFWLIDFDETYKSKAPSSTITGITKADPGVISAVHTFVVGDVVSVYGVVGMTELNNRTFKVNTVPSAGASLSLIDLDGNDAIDTTGFTTWTSGGIIVHRGLTLAASGKNIQNLTNAVFAGYDPMEIIGIEELEADPVTWWGETTQRPTRFQHKKSYTAAGAETNQLLWFPGADASYRLKYWYERRLARLSSDTDVPILPPQFQEMIISGAITRLAESQVQVENQVIWPGIYKMHQDSLAEFNRRWWEAHQSKEKRKPYLL